MTQGIINIFKQILHVEERKTLYELSGDFI